jgi:hypothetical protein
MGNRVPIHGAIARGSVDQLRASSGHGRRIGGKGGGFKGVIQGGCLEKEGARTKDDDEHGDDGKAWYATADVADCPESFRGSTGNVLRRTSSKWEIGALTGLA